jgi:hypothetical protein
VRLVDHVDLEAARRGGEEGALAQVASVVNTAVGGRVDLDDVDRAGAVGSQRDAGVALATRLLGPFSQFRERARIRAEEVLPQPRGPEKR